jgi:hypothetical protein
MNHLHVRRFINRFAVAALAAACLGSVVSAQPAAPDPAAAQRAEELNRQPDNVGTGPFAAMKEEVASLPEHVVYRPRDLDALGSQKLGVVAWGNGGCSVDGASSRFHLLELASHGYVVIASGRILSGPGASPRAAPVEGQPVQRTDAAYLTQAIDWALSENARDGSPFFGRIDPAQVAVSGFSCGGLEALRIGADPRVTAVVLHNTGILIDGPSDIPGMDLEKDQLLKLHTPVIYILGGESDIAYTNGMDDYKRIEHVPAAVANLLGAGHGGTYSQPNGGSAAKVAVNWLQWQLRDDAEAARSFTGADCGLCRDSAWTFERKGIE